jgi:hypothetical protein
VRRRRRRTSYYARIGEIGATRTWATVAAVACVGGLALLLASAEVRVLQADSYKGAL